MGKRNQLKSIKIISVGIKRKIGRIKLILKIENKIWNILRDIIEKKIKEWKEQDLEKSYYYEYWSYIVYNSIVYLSVISAVCSIC